MPAVVLAMFPFFAQAKDVLAPDALDAEASSKDFSVWGQSLYGKVDRETETRQPGFRGETKGVTVGADGYVVSDFSFGMAYTYAETDESGSDGSSATVDNNTVFAYGHYQPNDFFVDAAAAYGWGDGNRTSAAGVSEKFDSKMVLGQLLSGLSYENSAPLYGVRYVNFRTIPAMGNRLSSDVLTGIVKVQAGKTFATAENVSVRPEGSFAFTYDFISDSDAVVVLLPNGAGYAVDGKRLNRLGAELTVRLKVRMFERFELSAGYSGAFKPDFLNHAVTFRMRFDF